VTVAKVEIGFEGPARATAFRLDDPVYGLLDSGVLGVGETLVDLSSRLVSLQVRRGRTDDTEPSQTGRAGVVLRNRDGVLDPLNAASSLYPGVEPRRTVNIYADGVQVFSGFVDDIDLQYEPGGDANVLVTASDGFSRLALATLGTGIAVSEEDSGARISSVLAADSNLWAGTTDLDTGDSTLVAGTATGNALTYLRTVAQSEGGFLFVSRDGSLTFRNRNNPAQNPDSLTLSDAAGAAVRYTQIGRVAGVDDLFNIVTAASGGTTYTAQDSDSIADYGVRDLDLGALLLSADDTQDRVDYELAKRSRPLTRVSAITVDQSVSASTAVLNHELGEAVDIVFTPPGVAQQQQEAVLIALEHRFTAGQSWRTVFGLVSRDGSPFLVLDDVTYGLLNTGTLAF